MIKHIGCELVPILRKRDNFQDQNKERMTVETFLKSCWTQDKRSKAASSRAGFYLHQWQFPLSETAVSKLCGPGASEPLPHDILGDDLLRYWHEKELYMGDNPYQYIFMGREGTMSKLHRDAGGLMITIAPVIGTKEVVLVHRADGPTSLYHLQADLDHPDLDQFPLMFTTRVWKSVLRPGEILIMPQGTYHQCRNVTPCLSYHRFVLDKVNLKAFLESYFDGDATEIDHYDILWNACFELHSLVDAYTAEARREWQQSGKSLPAVEDTPAHMVRAVDTLKALRNIGKEMSSRLYRKGDEENGQWWNSMLEDIDTCLHRFRHRYTQNLPRQSRCRAHSMAKRSVRMNKELHTDITGAGEENPTDPLLLRFRRAPKLLPEEECTTLSDSFRLEVGDRVIAKVHGKKLPGTISYIRNTMKAVFVKYDDYDDFYNEFVPVDKLRIKVAGESASVGACPTDLRQGRIVYYRDHGEDYRAKVISCRKGTFYHVTLDISNCDGELKRWFCRESFLRFGDEESRDIGQPVIGDDVALSTSVSF